MKALIVDNWILWVAGVIGVFLVLGFTLYVIARVSTPLCWHNTVDQLASLTGERGIGSFRLLGLKSEFQLRLPVEEDCVKSVQFKGYKACMDICDGFSGKDREDCQKRCSSCKDKKACIITVPVKKSWWNMITSGDRGKTLRQIYTNIEAFPSDYSFEGDDVLEPIKPRNKLYCLDFSKSGDGYEISKKVIDVMLDASCGQVEA